MLGRPLRWLAWLALAAPLGGCGNEPFGDGCLTDNDCKGDRICRNMVCYWSDGGVPHDLAPPDLASPVEDMTVPADLLAPPDLTVPLDLAPPVDLVPLPSEQDCFTNWRNLGGACPAPVVTASYYTGANCAGTAGWVFEGHYFQFDKPDPSQPVLSWGPYGEGSAAYGHRNIWNRLSATSMCFTICVGCGTTIVGADVWAVNPDGKSSNHVTGGSRP
jgi:hypothetical protein